MVRQRKNHEGTIVVSHQLYHERSIWWGARITNIKWLFNWKEVIIPFHTFTFSLFWTLVKKERNLFRKKPRDNNACICLGSCLLFYPLFLSLQHPQVRDVMVRLMGYTFGRFSGVSIDEHQFDLDRLAQVTYLWSWISDSTVFYPPGKYRRYTNFLARTGKTRKQIANQTWKLSMCDLWSLPVDVITCLSYIWLYSTSESDCNEDAVLFRILYGRHKFREYSKYHSELNIIINLYDWCAWNDFRYYYFKFRLSSFLTTRSSFLVSFLSLTAALLTIWRWCFRIKNPLFHFRRTSSQNFHSQLFALLKLHKKFQNVHVHSLGIIALLARGVGKARFMLDIQAVGRFSLILFISHVL